jgi:hypothetical protein
MFRLLVPPSLVQELGDVVSKNEHVLTHPLDVYSTLRHVVDMDMPRRGEGDVLDVLDVLDDVDVVDDDDEENGTTTKFTSYRTDPNGLWGQQGVAGLSVFQPLPKERTCAEGGIPLHRCTCAFGLRVIVFDPNDKEKNIPKEYQEVYPRVIETVVGQLSHLGGGGKVSGCRMPHLLEVISFEVQRAPSRYDTVALFYFQLRFSIVEDPAAVFKATVPVQKRVDHKKGEEWYVLAPNLVGAREAGYTAGHKGNYLVSVDRITAMQKSCSKIVLAASTQELRQISEPHCVC